MRFLSTLAASALGTLLALGLLFFLGLAFIFALAASSDQVPSVRTGSVLVADLSGSWSESVPDDPLARALGGGPAVDLHDVTRAFRRAAADERIDAVWIRTGGVSAGWASLEAVRRQIDAVRAAGKPVYASSRSYMMSEKDFYLASAADSVFLDAESLFEFNGFELSVMFFSGLLRKADVDPQVIRSGKYKSAVEPYLRDDLSPENEDQLQAILSDVERRFVETVAGSRRMDATRVSALLRDGRIGTARDALAAGLIDGLRYEDEIEGMIRFRVGQDAEDRLRTVSLTRYSRVPDRQAGIPSGNEGEIAVVYAEGTMMAGESRGTPIPGLAETVLGPVTFAEAMDQARRDERVKAVVVRVNSPGGFAPAADAMRREIARTATEKPVYLSMGDVAASGGYWIATAADTIVTEPLTLTGSIGVFSLFFDFSGLFERHLGITFDGVQTGPSADAMSMLRPLSEAERAAMERDADAIYGSFVAKVAEGRGLTRERADALGQGRVWTGEAAVANGLADLVGGLDEAVELAARRVGLAPGAYRVRELPRPLTFIEELNRAMEVRMQTAARRLGFGLDPRLESVAEEMTALADMASGIHARMPMRIDIH